MATVTGLTATYMQDIVDATVVDGSIDISGHLILEHHDGSTTDAGSALPALPSATTTAQGIVELATDAEATAGTDTVRAVTPHALSAAVGVLVPDATISVKGKVQLATDVDATAGTNTTLVMTPANVKAAVPVHMPQASTTVQGKVELATTAEATTGTDTVRAVTPAGLKAAIDAAMQLIFPVGSIYTSYTNAANPSTLLGFGTWTAIQGRMLVGNDGSTFGAGGSGGSQTHTISSGEMPNHSHSFSGGTSGASNDHSHNVGRDTDGGSGTSRFTVHSAGVSGAQAVSPTSGISADHSHSFSGTTGAAGSGSAMNIMNPYLVVYLWRRTA
jgi:microcystin-dependent protein